MPANWFPRQARFPTTRWSLVDRAGDRGSGAAGEALDQLLGCYLPALQAHLVRGKGLSPEDADDVVQEFITRKVLQRDLLARADQEVGKFRTFLLAALDRFVANWHRDRGAKKRAVEAAGPLGDRAEALPGGAENDVFDLAWARQVIAETLQRMRAECGNGGRPEVFTVFEGRVLGPILDGAEPVDYDELVRQCGFASASQASNVLVTAKRMFARTLRGVVGEYAGDAAEIEAELDELHRVLARGGR
jgi:RNA polymerase sigma-70 factor (ECF subfamily)